MTIMELAAIPLRTLGIAAAITGALALFLCAFADESLFMPDLSRRKILIWGLVLVTGSAPCLLLASAVRPSVTTNESDWACAPCGDLTQVGGIPGMGLRQYAGRHDRHASDSAKMGIRRFEAR